MATKTNIPSLEGYPSEMKKFVQLMINCGAIPDPKIQKVTAQQASQKFNEKCYHNTKKLLENYREVAWMLNDAPMKLAEELDVPFTNIDALAERINTEEIFENGRLEHQLKSFEDARRSVTRLLEAVSALKYVPKNGERMFNVINQYYLTKEKHTVEKIASELNMSTATLHRIRKDAISLIAYRMWGSANKMVDIALRAMTIYEKTGEQFIAPLEDLSDM